MADGMWVKIASPTGDHCQDAQGRLRAVKRKEKRVVLSALGLWDDGHWEIVHWQIATGETEAAWHHFLGELYQKGLTDETAKLIISDGSKGLESAWITIPTGCLINVVSVIRSKIWLTIWYLTI
jgi:hypothetical protein